MPTTSGRNRPGLPRRAAGRATGGDDTRPGGRRTCRSSGSSKADRGRSPGRTSCAKGSTAWGSGACSVERSRRPRCGRVVGEGLEGRAQESTGPFTHSPGLTPYAKLLLDVPVPPSRRRGFTQSPCTTRHDDDSKPLTDSDPTVPTRAPGGERSTASSAPRPRFSIQ